MLLFEREIEHNDLFAIYKLIKMQATDWPKIYKINCCKQPGSMNTIVIMSNMCQQIEVQKPKKKKFAKSSFIETLTLRTIEMCLCVRACDACVNKYYYLKAKLQQNPAKLTFKYRFILSQIQLTPK